MIKDRIASVMGFILDKMENTQVRYRNSIITKQLGGGDLIIQYPYHITGVRNIVASEPINIGVGSTLFTGGRAKLVIKQHFVSGPGLTIITGDHMPLVGKFLDTVTNEDKDKYDTNHQCDQDVTIEEDVWCGANVTILKGVTIGRGCIIAAGAVVTKSIPPYCVAGGVPARPLKMRWTVKQIIEHESIIYSEKNRLPIEQIEAIKANI